LRLTIAEAFALIRPTPMFEMEALVAGAPRGDGHGVLVLPALGCGDRYTARVREFLNMLGYAAYGWSLGVNIGPTKRLLAGSVHRLVELSDQHGPISIVGFSMGGMFARLLAKRLPDRVRQIITVCSPIHDPANNFWLPLQSLAWLRDSPELRRLAEEVEEPPSVPCTAIYSRDDGLVNWSACLDPASPQDDVEIAGAHVLIARNPQVMKVFAERLGRCPATQRRRGP
jgi:pimeloyl-ACP methyl ester carboxylesterase